MQKPGKEASWLDTHVSVPTISTKQFSFTVNSSVCWTPNHFSKAIEALGAQDEGAPGARGGKFYGAYFRDLDGNKLAVFCMTAWSLSRIERNQMSEQTKASGPASYFPSIEKKYGQPIDHWIKLVKQQKGLKHMELVNWLKSEHGLGHGHANAIVAFCFANKA